MILQSTIAHAARDQTDNDLSPCFGVYPSIAMLAGMQLDVFGAAINVVLSDGEHHAD
jgi:hypothetical protein